MAKPVLTLGINLTLGKENTIRKNDLTFIPNGNIEFFNCIVCDLVLIQARLFHDYDIPLILIGHD